METDIDIDDGVAPSADPPGAGRLGAGAALAGGRYQIVGLVGRGAFGEVYRATDKTNGAPVALRLLNPDLLRQAGLDRLRAELAIAAKLDHKNIARTLDFGQEQDLVFVVTEHVDGQTLRSLLQRKRAAGAPAFSLKGAYNVIAHVCNALAYAHKGTIHGALSASNVLVNKAGRVKLTEFGLARAFPAFARLAAQVPEDLAAMAPEVATAPQSTDRRADLYATGAILHELLTGRPPSESLVRPSALIAGLSPEIDAIVARCLAPSPQDRFTDAMQLKNALYAIVEQRGAAAAATPQPHAPAAAAPRVSAPQPRVSAPRAVAGPGKPSAGGVALDEHEEKWLIQKDKLDFGPFSFVQVKEQIAKDQILPGNIIIDNENGQRCKVEDHPLLHDLVMAAAQRRDDLRRANAELVVVKQEKRKGAALYVFIALGVAALGGGGWFAYKKWIRPPEQREHAAEIASLEGAELKVAIEIKPAPPKGSGGGRRGGGSRGGGSRGGGGGGDGFDEALDLGSAEDGEESEVLDNSQINPVLQRHGGALAGCLRSAGERRAEIEFLIKGSTGRVYAVRVNGSTTSGVAQCMKRVMSGMQFPTFRGPRTRVSFDMSY